MLLSLVNSSDGRQVTQKAKCKKEMMNSSINALNKALAHILVAIF
jgi:hypothetical protein